MKLAIMQPYFFPYIGYFQLINAVDKFVVYDNIQFTKKGWINRNRILIGGKDEYITLPLKKDSDFLDIRDRILSATFDQERVKMLRKIKEAYRKAPFFDETYPMVEEALNYTDTNLFNFIFHSIQCVCRFLEIKTELVVSSTLSVDHTLKSEERVLAICESLGGDTYINPIGGTALYDKATFQERNIELRFLEAKPILYPQLQHSFVPFLSIIDVMMFNSKEQSIQMLASYKLFEP
jgi:hypothetical protein